MSVNSLFDVGHTGIANFDGVSVEGFMQGVIFGKFFIKYFTVRNVRPMFGATFLIYGGLYQVTFLCRLLFWPVDTFCGGGGLNLN